jgi:cytidylate kinase
MELKKLNSNIDVLEVKKALKLRNILDKKRKHSPLKRHKNAVVVNTGKLNKQAMVVKMSKSVEKILRTKYGN